MSLNLQVVNAANEEEFLRQQERERAQRSRIEPSAPNVRLETAVEETISIQNLPTETPCFQIDRIDIQEMRGGGGANQPPSGLIAGLNSNIQDHLLVPRCLGIKSVNAIVKHLQNQLLEQGWTTARLVVSDQDLSSGTLRIDLIPGRVRDIKIVTPDASLYLLRNALPMSSGDLLNLRDIEQGLENLKRIPSADADIDIVPSDGENAQLGDSDLHIKYRHKLPIRLNLSVDDSGTKATGKRIGNATVSVDNPLGISDLFYLSLNSDIVGQDGTQGTRGRTLHYSFPLGYWLLALSANESTYHQTIAGLNGPYVYRGNSSNLEARLSRLVWRTATQKTTLGVRAFQRTSHNYVEDTEVSSQKRIVGGWEGFANHKLTLGNSSLDSNLGYRRGTGDFGTLPAPEESSGEGTSGFALLAGDITLNHPFTLFEQKLRFNSNFRFQRHYTPLTLQDRFSIGGRYTVRGFDGEQLLSAESGQIWRNELAFSLPAQQELYFALDEGRVNGNSSNNLVGQKLCGTVIGLRGGIGTLQYDFFGGRPLKAPEGFRTASYTTGFAVYLSF